MVNRFVSKKQKHDPETHPEFKGGTQRVWTKEELIAFEEEIGNLFLAAKIRAAVHLSRGNEEPLLEIFKGVNPEDWVFSTHRSHYHALLKGISPEWLKQEILEGRSIGIHNKEHNFFSSAIVGGCLSIALGVAVAIKRKNENRHVWCFVGDMAAETGIFYECTKYAKNFNLPITFVIEDNGLSVNTPTWEVWGINALSLQAIRKVYTLKEWHDKGMVMGKILYYRYKRGFPHSGTGLWIKF